MFVPLFFLIKLYSAQLAAEERAKNVCERFGVNAQSSAAIGAQREIIETMAVQRADTKHSQVFS